jgi:protein-S-isoprenylcysteine O-methyltransferase Ste14
VLVLFPAMILLLTRDSRFHPDISSPDEIRFWVSLLLAGVGIMFSIWTSTLFRKFGEGTPAPWDPPQKIVIRGPYRHVRNPMITSVLVFLLAEAIFFQSWPIAFWMIIFFFGNAVYFPLVEEKGLEKRFGEDYLKYKAHVPRWIPRLQGWKDSQGDR